MRPSRRIPTGRSATTDADGVYSLKLVPGTYDVTFAGNGYDPVTQNVVIRRDQMVTIDVSLTAPVAVVEPASIEAAAEIGADDRNGDRVQRRLGRVDLGGAGA